MSGAERRKAFSVVSVAAASAPKLAHETPRLAWLGLAWLRFASLGGDDDRTRQREEERKKERRERRKER